MAQKTEHAPARRRREHDVGGVRLRRRGARSRRRLGAPLLGCVPLDAALREAGDRGRAARLERPRRRPRAGRSSTIAEPCSRSSPSAARDRQGAAGPRRLIDVRSGRAPPRARLLGRGRRASLADHFLDAEAAASAGHGLARVDWLASLPGLDPSARPKRSIAEPGYERWDGRRRARLPDARRDLRRAARRSACAGASDRRRRLLPDRDARLLGAPARERRSRGRADGDVAAAARAPGRRSEPLVGTNAARDRRSRARTESPSSPTSRWAPSRYGDVLAGLASPDELVPFGGEQAHKAFALAVGPAAARRGAGAGDVRRAPARRAAGGAIPCRRSGRAAAGLRLPGDS